MQQVAAAIVNKVRAIDMIMPIFRFRSLVEARVEISVRHLHPGPSLCGEKGKLALDGPSLGGEKGKLALDGPSLGGEKGKLALDVYKFLTSSGLNIMTSAGVCRLGHTTGAVYGAV
jgi:hypothetical protein